MSPDQAYALAEAEVIEIGVACGEDLMLSEKTVKVSEGWVFFYNTREFVETGNFSSHLAGNCPIFIDRGGRIHYLPTSIPWDVALEKLRKSST
ncbi:YrhB domain-containing protein [Bradyrhizobium sp. Pa8]|uniref:YrhB domain-containing protein n=1 Tax=Bradyrhizobium sp. Pa8 TaxID=3386552 RepID=UPI00403F1AC1